jgi:hypothetical protein
LAVGQEVAGGGYVVRWQMGCLQVDRVEAADDAVVGEGHLGCDVGGGVGRLDGMLLLVWTGVFWGGLVGAVLYVLGECEGGYEGVGAVGPLRRRRHVGFFF